MCQPLQKLWLCANLKREWSKRLSLELGGNAPFLVFNSADLDEATAGAIAAKFRNAGQTCISPNRFLVQSGVYEDFIARLVQKVCGLRIGNGLDEGVSLGPLISKEAAQKVPEYLEDALAAGGRSRIRM